MLLPMADLLLGHLSGAADRIGFGAMPLSLAGRPDESEAVKVLHRVFDAGIRFIDTADSYCIDDGDTHHNERLVAKALALYGGRAEGIRVATKGGLLRPKGAWMRDSNPLRLWKTIRESHEALGGREPIFLWQHHAPDPNYSADEVFAPVREALEEGLIAHVGVSNYSVREIEQARELVAVVSVQNQFSLWHRNPERDGVLEYCTREKLTFIAWRPLGGKHGAAALAEMEPLAHLAREKGVSPQRLVLAWMVGKWPVILPIPGASSIVHADSLVHPAEVVLSEEEIALIDTVQASASA